MTASFTTDAIARIDILEGANLEGMMKPWLILVHSEEAKLPEAIESIGFRFDKVVFIDDNGARFDPRTVGELVMPRLLGIEVLGRDIKSAKNGDFVLTIELFGITFRGHYNTNKRKGSLLRIK